MNGRDETTVAEFRVQEDSIHVLKHLLRLVRRREFRIAERAVHEGRQQCGGDAVSRRIRDGECRMMFVCIPGMDEVAANGACGLMNNGHFAAGQLWWTQGHEFALQPGGLEKLGLDLANLCFLERGLLSKRRQLVLD